jgi:hypothetical protein
LIKKPDQSLRQPKAQLPDKTHQTISPNMINKEMEMSTPKHPPAISVKKSSQTETDVSRIVFHKQKVNVFQFTEIFTSKIVL